MSDTAHLLNFLVWNGPPKWGSKKTLVTTKKTHRFSVFFKFFCSFGLVLGSKSRMTFWTLLLYSALGSDFPAFPEVKFLNLRLKIWWWCRVQDVLLLNFKSTKNLTLAAYIWAKQSSGLPVVVVFLTLQHQSNLYLATGATPKTPNLGH